MFILTGKRKYRGEGPGSFLKGTVKEAEKTAFPSSVRIL